jgi:hypothetical protein
MTVRKNIYAYFLSLAISLLLIPQTAEAQRKKIVEVPDSVPFFRGVAVSADLVGLGMVMLSDYGQYEGAVRVNLRDRYFPIVEVGLGKADHTNAMTNLRYSTSAPYGRIGIDFNLMKNKHDIYRLYGGVRYAYTLSNTTSSTLALKTRIGAMWLSLAQKMLRPTIIGQRWCSALRPRFGALFISDGVRATSAE